MGIIESNSTMQKLLGYTEDELKNMKPYDFIHHNSANVDEKISKLPEGQYGLVGPRKYITKNGDILDVEVSANIIQYRGRKVISVVSWDVTELKNAHEEILELNEILRLMARITRHDIRNRLTIAYGITDLMKNGFTPDKNVIGEANNAIKKAIDITKRMNELESLLLSGSSIREVDLKDLIEEIIVDFPVKYSISGDGKVKVDNTFSSVIENLVGNAIFHGKADRIEINIREEKEGFHLTFADNGTGIPDEIKDRVFEESVSYGSNRGTGLGLFIVKKVVERSNGEVWLDDSVSKGATFILKLPKIKNSRSD